MILRDDKNYTYTCLMALCPGLPGWAGSRKVKPIWILLKQETVSGSEISTRLQTDNHASTSSLTFLQAGCPSCHPSNSVKALKAQKLYQSQNSTLIYLFIIWIYFIFLYFWYIFCFLGSCKSLIALFVQLEYCYVQNIFVFYERKKWFDLNIQNVSSSLLYNQLYNW